MQKAATWYRKAAEQGYARAQTNLGSLYKDGLGVEPDNEQAVYWYQHIGNLRTYVFNDILKRVLEYNGYKVDHVMNVTDVGHLTSDADEGEDKMEEAAKKEDAELEKKKGFC